MDAHTTRQTVSLHHGGKITHVAKISFHRINAGKREDSVYDTITHAKALGVTYVEFDVRRTSDHVMVAWHDPRLPSGRAVSDVPYSVYAQEAAGMACTIEELIDATGGCPGLHVDLKEIGYEDEVVRLLLAKCSPADFVITSLEDESIQHIKTVFPVVRCGLSLGRDTAHENLVKRIAIRASELLPGHRLKVCRADFVAVNYKLARLIVLRYCKKHRLPAWVWTVDDAQDMREFLSSPEVEVLITNAPDVAVTLATTLCEQTPSTTTSD
jgi:glycerophosphoryl diester phosphodiesterase